MTREVQSNENYTAPVRTFSIRGPFRKIDFKWWSKRRINPNLRQYGHAGLDSTRERKYVLSIENISNFTAILILLSDPIVLDFLLLFAAGVGHDRGKLTTRNSILKDKMIILFLV